MTSLRDAAGSYILDESVNDSALRREYIEDLERKHITSAFEDDHYQPTTKSPIRPCFSSYTYKLLCGSGLHSHFFLVVFPSLDRVLFVGQSLLSQPQLLVLVCSHFLSYLQPRAWHWVVLSLSFLESWHIHRFPSWLRVAQKPQSKIITN